MNSLSLNDFLKTKKGAFVLGSLTIFSSAPFYFPLPLFAFGFVFFNYTLNKSYKYLLTFFCAYYFANFHWILHSMLIEGESMFLLAIFCAFLMPLFLSSIFFIFFLIFEKIKLKLSKFFINLKFDTSVLNYLFFSFSFFAAEFFRAKYLFGGFNWQTFELIFSATDFTIQSFAFFQRDLLHLFCIFIFFIPYLKLSNSKYFYTFSYILFFIFCFLMSLCGLSFFTKKSSDEKFKNINFILIQENIPQSYINNIDLSIDVSRKYYQSAARFKHVPNSVIVLPESAVPYFNKEEKANLQEQFSKILADENSFIVINATEIDYKEKTVYSNTFAVDKYYNEVLSYNKHHLAPFGEYNPLKSIFPFVNQMVGMGEFSVGRSDQQKVFTLKNGLQIRPLICYEIIFNDIIDKNNKPDIIINTTNDAWFGKTIGPYQHLAIARIQAVINKIPIIRVANSGISAIINSDGTIYKKINLNSRGEIIANYTQIY